ARAIAVADVNRSFDLQTDAPIRTRLIRLAAEEHHLVISLHHIASDAWSHNVFVQELNALYAASSEQGRDPVLTPLTIQYADYADWEARNHEEAGTNEDLAYWRGRLEGVQPLELPTDCPRSGSLDEQAGVVEFSLPEALVDQLEQLSQRCRASLFMTLLAGFQVLLSRYSGQSDITVGVPTANRNHAETEKLIGFFVNTLVLRSDLAGNPTFSDLLAQVREHALDAYEHQNLPFERLVEELQPERDLSRTPLFQTMFQLDHGETTEWNLGSLDVEEVIILPQATKFDLTLDATLRGGSLNCRFGYRSALFEPATIERLAQYYRAILRAAVDSPIVRIDEIDLCGPEERDLHVIGWNSTAVAGAARTLPERVARIAARAPGQRAITQGDRYLSYGQLNNKAGRLARRLRDLGCAPETPVAVLLERGVDHLVASLAVMKAGGVYVPIDPKLSVERAAFIMGDTGAPMVLTHAETVGKAPHGAWEILDVAADDIGDAPPTGSDDESELPPPGHDSAAYIIYTSGSTGTPKGIVIEHGSLANLVESLQRAHALAPGEATLQKSSPAFDVSIQETFWPLSVGAHVVAVDHGRQGDVLHLAEVIRRWNVTTVGFVPSLLRTFVTDPRVGSLPSLCRVLSGGEVLTPELAQSVIDRFGCEIYNLYGPSETTVDVAESRFESGDKVVTIGRPMSNVQMYVVDRNDRPTPVGVPGEILVGGVQVGRGYLNRPELTAEHFLQNPLTGAPAGRVYRTGDKARYLPDGRVEFLGRLDEQMKIRGYRVEPAEIESALNTCEEIADSAVVAKEHGPGDLRLHAFVVAAPGRSTPSDQELRLHLGLILPRPLVPNFFVSVEKLPRTVGGKIDRNRLRDRATTAPGAAGHVSGIPRTREELLVGNLFGEVLGRPQAGPGANFFDLGGHSLLAASLAAKVQSVTGFEMPLAEIFRRPTVAGIAELVANGRRGYSPSPLVPIDSRGTGKPIFCVHPIGGGVYCYLDLARHLRRSRPLFGLQARGLDAALQPDRTVEEMAARYLDEIRGAGHEGPYTLLGWSFGGVVAYEMARSLRAAAQSVDLVLLDSLPPGHVDGSDVSVASAFVNDLAGIDGDTGSGGTASGGVAEEFERARSQGLIPPSLHLEQFTRRVDVYGANLRAMAAYSPEPAEVPAALYRPSDSAGSLDEGWRRLTAGRLTVHEVSGNHYSILREPELEQWAGNLLDKE
ncbi:non-ribosomal peptide synthetase, partial [Streptomyces anulatus]